jgi:2-dehydro-3-deoxy-D-gluconate 5-dehydrogenase
MSMFDLTGRVAIVTGGNGGIGLGIAEGLVAAGASVMLSGRNVEKGAAALAKLGERAAFHAGDMSRHEACAELVAATVQRFGRLDILVNNAGMSIRKQPQEFTEEDWHRVINTNLTGPFLLCQLAYPHFIKAGGGKIINIASVNALLGAPHNVPYAASKGGLAALTRGLATAWAKENIQVNAILPGWIETEMTDTAKAHVPGLSDYVTLRTPAGRWGKPADLAGLAVFLAASGSDWVTGMSIPADGGYSIRA